MNLRNVRIGLGISQTCLAKLLGCTQHRISELETGKGWSEANQATPGGV